MKKTKSKSQKVYTLLKSYFFYTLELICQMKIKQTNFQIQISHWHKNHKLKRKSH